ncbi:hypothetical protein KP509_08G026300 [Ceratopteris richardii]|uniref:Uncharacterized protein n=1 Tax=Ceratopteris richardii TaxID=49495 RepID=A0A8T2U4D8_CERRI|nr:hypothetical protein KP509_08G026300 [Ceratopteris richardii]
MPRERAYDCIKIYSCVHNVSFHELHKTFGTWTFLTFTLCILCARDLENQSFYLATLLSFIYALGYFLIEFLMFDSINNNSNIFLVKGTSIFLF